jgi:hypothetical protein
MILILLEVLQGVHYYNDFDIVCKKEKILFHQRYQRYQNPIRAALLVILPFSL